ncbi:2738_t:CDS:1 [Paraglomus occultum]|uniref:2738_t:CDS:1 n=1 Tax=Paraglomus occultum TaxID=144539 RepID=A0A9N9C1S6_9GLOM|nr:2738_t:CDS:1 [Paraglomus occultum]
MKISAIFTVALSIALLSNATPFEKRRFGQEHSAFVEPLYQKMRDSAQGTNFAGQVGQLSGEAVNALLAAKPACRQQQVADHLVFFAKKMGADKTIADGKRRQKNLIDIAKKYRTAERNTNQDGKPSFLCGRKPFFKELNGIVQRQDPAATTKPDTPKDAFNLDADFDPLGVLSQIKAASNNGGASDPKDKPKDPKKKPKDPKKKPKDPKDKPKEPKKNPKGKTGNPAADNPLGGSDFQMPFIKKNADGTFSIDGVVRPFKTEAEAHKSQCSMQHNACGWLITVDDKVTLSDCDKQEKACIAGPTVFA